MELRQSSTETTNKSQATHARKRNDLICCKATNNFINLLRTKRTLFNKLSVLWLVSVLCAKQRGNHALSVRLSTTKHTATTTTTLPTTATSTWQIGLHVLPALPELEHIWILSVLAHRIAQPTSNQKSSVMRRSRV